MRIKICRKEAKESRFWLRLVDTENDDELEKERKYLVNESTELMNIFGAILQKSKSENEESKRAKIGIYSSFAADVR